MENKKRIKKELLPLDQRQMHKKIIITFIEEYRNNPCLWNTKCKEYNDRKLKKLGYEKLINLLRPSIPEVNKDYIVKKVNILRSCFRKEHKKVLESLEKSTETPYRPSLWYYDLLLFTVDEKYQTKSEKTELIFQILENECTNSNEISNQQDDNILKHEEPQQNENIFIEIEIPDKPEYINKANKRLKIEPENNSDSTQQTKSFNSSNLTSKEQNSNTNNNSMLCDSNQDEFDVFGFLVASKLRKISMKNETQQLFCENIINQALMKGLLGKLTEHSVIEG